MVTVTLSNLEAKSVKYELEFQIKILMKANQSTNHTLEYREQMRLRAEQYKGIIKKIEEARA